MRIIFVDDEKSVLEGIENRLRRYRRRWDMNFSTSGKQALQMMADKPYDAVVSDMRMPEMDGAEFLKNVRDKYNGTLRIILTGQTAKEQVMRSLSVAHRVLNKPCDALRLESAIGDATSLEKLITNEKVRKLIDKIEGLPSLPRLHLAITQLIIEEGAELKKIAELIQGEPSISARVLQLVNSSFLGLAREITCIKDAVSYLGLDCVRGLVLSQELLNAYSNTKLPNSFSLERYQQKSAIGACIAKKIAMHTPHEDLVYTGALLHGIGYLVLSHAMPQEYEELIQTSLRDDIPMAEVETRSLGFSHADVGAYLLSLWDLPFDVIDMVGNYYTPSISGEAALGPIGYVHVASVLASAQYPSTFDTAYDLNYLDNIDLENHMPQWQSLVTECYNHV